jgi:PAS domain S-box-containing protein
MNHDEFGGLARALFEESSDALLLVDPDTGNILDANGAAQRLSGFSLRAVVGAPVSDFFRLSVGRWAISFPMPARTVQLSYAEWGGLYRTFLGGNLPVDVTFTRLSAKPHPLAMVRIRQAIRPAPAPGDSPGGGQLKHLVAAVNDCLWSATASERGDGQFQFLSPVVEQISGRTAEAIGKRLKYWRNLIHPDDQAAWDEAFEKRQEGKATQDEYRIVWPDKSVRWVRDDARAIRAANGRSVHLYGVFANITAWRQGEITLRRLADLVDTAEDAIISQSTDGLIVDWNRGAERLYGYTKEEIKAQPVLRLFVPDEAREFAEAVQRVKRGEPSATYQATQIHKSGERIAVSLRISAIGREADSLSIIARNAD